MDDHLAPLGGDWALRRDFAVRSAGFPVAGLEAFGADDEEARLHDIAVDPAFREAVTWQNRDALASAVDGLLEAGGAPSKKRRREEVVARYWQRYCSKNDTIGFFGPLAWGELRDDGPALTQHSRGLVRERTVHFETWCLERFLQSFTDDPWLPLGPWPEEDARSRIASIADDDAREGATIGLERLEAARKRIVAASRDEVGTALAEFDRVFEDTVGEPPVRTPELAGGGRTPVYMDAMRDLHVSLGPGLVAELGASLPPLLESSRWLCGRSFELGCGLMMEAIGSGGRRPLAPLFGKVFSALREMPRLLASEHDELQRRWAALLDDPERTTIAARARAEFSDFGPAWPISVFHSPDLQIAAADADAVERGDYLVVIGDYHPGTNPLGQGLFSYRHPDRQRFLETWGSDVGTPTIYPLPPRVPQVPMTARFAPAVGLPGDIVVLPPMPEVRARPGLRVVSVADLLVDGATITDHEGSFRAPVHSLFWPPMFVATVFSYEPFPSVEHAERITAGRTVYRRESWRISIGDCPSEPAAVAGWARDHGMPRRVFVRMPDERKPTYLDVESPVLARIFCRQIRRRAESAEQLVAVSEMLPRPEDCWLELEGERYTSELRIAAVDLTRRGHARIEVG
ncbi:MAG TPA: lantibiotic dehydratase [Gaiellaceae bacterium]|nr:lantibiotic dehydratase [Gaiellaceae bacterium]